MCERARIFVRASLVCIMCDRQCGCACVGASIFCERGSTSCHNLEARNSSLRHLLIHLSGTHTAECGPSRQSGEREKERERDRDRNRDRETETQRDRERERESCVVVPVKVSHFLLTYHFTCARQQFFSFFSFFSGGRGGGGGIQTRTEYTL